MSDTTTLLLVAGVAIVALVIIFFLVMRRAVLWYFRIDERTALLREIRDSLQQAADRPANGWRLVGISRRPGETQDQFNSRASQLQAPNASNPRP